MEAKTFALLVALAMATLIAPAARADDRDKNPPQVTVGAGYVVNSAIGTVNGNDQAATTVQGAVGSLSFHDDAYPYLNSASASFGRVGNTYVGGAELLRKPNPRDPYDDLTVVGLSGRNTNQYFSADFVYGAQERFGSWDGSGVRSQLFFHLLPASLLMSHPGGQPDQTFYAPGVHAGGNVDFGPYVSAFADFGMRALVATNGSNAAPNAATDVGSMLAGEAGLAGNFWVAGQKFQVAASAQAEEAVFKRVDAPPATVANGETTGFRDVQGNLTVRTAF